MTDSSLREFELAELCGIALDEGDVKTAKAHAEAGLRLATEKGGVKWMLRFKLLLARMDPDHEEEPQRTPEPLYCSFCGQAGKGKGDLVAGPASSSASPA